MRFHPALKGFCRQPIGMPWWLDGFFNLMVGIFGRSLGYCPLCCAKWLYIFPLIYPFGRLWIFTKGSFNLGSI